MPVYAAVLYVLENPAGFSHGCFKDHFALEAGLGGDGCDSARAEKR
jgi:hypothetical protein